MKVLKLVLGILSIVFSVLISSQSFLVGIGNAISQNNEISGSMGLLVSIMMLTGGIVMIVTRNSEHKAGSIACIVLYIFAGLAGITNAGTYTDLKFWSAICLIIAAVNILSILKKK